ncbi:hypothetical protein Trydic_g3726 [Trypoxylus dichotomus]
MLSFNREVLLPGFIASEFSAPKMLNIINLSKNGVHRDSIYWLLRWSIHRTTSGVDSAESSPWIKDPLKILSSTLNDSITAAVENCKLEQSNSNGNGKKCTNSYLKQIREPSTPDKSLNKRCYNTKTSPRSSPMLKLGSPERNEILYCNFLRTSDSKRNSPAKKRLFCTSKRGQDPVMFFCIARNCNDVMSNVFTMLADEDLYNCTKVSHRWKKEVESNRRLKVRLEEFVINRIMNKENNFDSPMLHVVAAGYSKQSTPIDVVSKITEITKFLTENQHLEKCVSCKQATAIVEHNISQCRKCGTIRCLKCTSISTTGPENFVNKCQQSILLFEKPPSRFSLLNSPKRVQNSDGTPTFLRDDSFNTSQICNSSGYLTDNELSQSRLSQSRLSQSRLSQSRRNSLSSTKDKETGDFPRVLKDHNLVVSSRFERDWIPQHSILPVIPSTRRREEIIEPSSPPKVKDVAGSKKSKKSLKRLVKL